jgi:phosphoribosylformimino-5-aminoimidazole carboxamide ribotide isomerase
MDLYARVNIWQGNAVRLPRGDVADALVLDEDPVNRAHEWVAAGADIMHVVDIDAALGDYSSRPIVEDIVESLDVPVQAAGGVRTPSEVDRLIGYGAWRVVMGTAAMEDQVTVWELCRTHPERIAVALDVRPDEEIAIAGWTKGSGIYLEQALIDLSSAGMVSFLVAEAGRDALTEATNMDMLRMALELVTEPVVASGGARDLDDLRALRDLEVDGRRLAGVVVGREVTEGRFTVEEAKGLLASSSG